jgi:pimeloyl-ACP methyl ester carboxylesterase
MKDLNFKTAATLMTGLDSVMAAGLDPFKEIETRKRLIEIASDALGPGGNARGRRAELQHFFEDRGWGTVVWSFYGTLLMELEERLNPGDHGGEQRPVYAVGYDWRQSNIDSGNALKKRIDQILGAHPAAKKVIVVSHSMGGLVARSAIAQGATDKIQGVAHTVMPADGAVVAYRRFLTGAREELGETEGPLRSILGPNRVHYTVMQSVLRGPVELMPHDAYPEVFLRFHNGINNKFFQKIFDEYARTEPPGVVVPAGTVDESENFKLTITPDDVSNLRSRFKEASQFASKVAGKFHPNTFLLYGRKKVTDTEFDWTRGKATADGANMASMCVRIPDGDGTVPRASAHFALCDAHRDDSIDVEHATCFSVAAFRTRVKDAIDDLAGRA